MPFSAPANTKTEEGSPLPPRFTRVESVTLFLSVASVAAAVALLWLVGPQPLPSLLLVVALGTTFTVGYLVRKIESDRQRDATLLSEVYARFSSTEKARREVGQKMRDLAAVAVENARLYEEAQARTQELTSLLKVSETLTSTLNAPALLQMVSRQVRSLIGCDFVAFIHVDREAGTLMPMVVHQPEMGPPLELPSRLGEGLVGRVALTGRAEALNRKSEAVWLEVAEHIPPGLHSALCVPLVVESRVDGVIALGRIGTRGFDADDLRLVAIISGQISAVLENISLHEQVKDQAVRDGLTQVFNRGYLYERLAEELLRAEQSGAACSFIMLDIDNFKAFNDSHGHLAGDEMLRRVSQAITQSVRKVDVVGRYGGEEFGIVLPQTSAQAAYAVGERIRKAVEELGTDAVRWSAASDSRKAARVTVSLGVSAYPEMAGTHVDLVARADEALYRSKALGKNKVSLAEAEVL
jgi:two-component system, cell cycle response regulator